MSGHPTSARAAPALSWASDLQASAQSFANWLASNCAFQHSGGPDGENLAAGYSSWASVVDGWYNEVGMSAQSA
jgi:uncharacterized protein YkwD